MASSNNYFDQVGAFLDNELSGKDLARFNEELLQNPELAKELNLQKEMIEGIKEYRRSELKARLDSVPTGGGFWSGTAVKIISGVAIVTGIGYGIYELSNDPQVEDTPKVEEATKIEQSSIDEIPAIVTEEEVTPQETGTDSEAQVEEEVKGNTDPEENEVITDSPITAPAIPMPDSFDMDEPTEEDLQLPDNSLGTEEEVLESQLEIEIITNKRKYPFHYQVTDGRLLLYGDFDEEPYELLEISVNNEKKLYLYFKDKYYEITEDADEITPLQSISNKSLITELEKMKNKDY